MKLAAAPHGIDEITPTGVVVDGQLHEVDCIIFATGFETGTSAADLFGYDITGCDGLALSEYFVNGHQTLHGFYSWVPKLLRTGPQPERVHRQLHVHARSESSPRGPAPRARQSIWHHRNRAIQGGTDSWVQIIRELKQPRLAYFMQCTPGYYTGQADLSRSFWVSLMRAARSNSGF